MKNELTDNLEVSSEIKLQSELNLAACSSRCRELPESRIPNCEFGAVRSGQKELRRVRQVECFSAKLQIEPFGKEEIAEHGEIKILRAWATTSPAPQITKLPY